MLLAELVETLDAVATTSSRTQKRDALAEILARLDPEEIVPAVGYLSGEPRQGKIGVGWATLSKLGDGRAAAASLRVADLDEALTEIARTTGPGSAAGRTRILEDLFGRATPGEADFVRRLLTGELRQGALEGVGAEAIARAAGVPAPLVRRALMFSGDLRRTAVTALRDGAPGLEAIGLVLLRPIKPMLASTAEDVTEAFQGIGRASVEWKLDGVRIQVHRVGAEVRVFTRNLNDVTSRMPEVVATVSKLPAERVVLDGEAILLGPAERPHAFQETMSRVGRRDTGHELTLAPHFFDCLHLDGTDLVDRPLSDRLDVLDELTGPLRIPGIQTEDRADGERFLADALVAGHEGVMVKALDSLYQAGRRGKAWRKVKPVRTLDLVVLAAEWGHGRRRGWLSNLHLGARDASGGFVMVGKTFKGLTDELLRWQTSRFLELETAREGIVVHVRPELVVEIELDGVQVSTRYPGGVALRFARVKGYRPDKDPQDADTIETVRALLPGA